MRARSASDSILGREPRTAPAQRTLSALARARPRRIRLARSPSYLKQEHPHVVARRRVAQHLRKPAEIDPPCPPGRECHRKRGGTQSVKQIP